MKKVYLLFLIPVVFILAASGCGLFGPSPVNIMQWMPEVTTASTLSYRWSGSYQQAGKDYFGEESPTPETENYSIIEVTAGETITKIVAREQSGYRFFLIADDGRGMIFLSDDEYADIYDDAVLLTTPVKVGTSWTSEFYGKEATFTIQEVNASHTTGAGTYTDTVIAGVNIIDTDYDFWSGVLIKAYWSPTAGFLGFVETFPQNTDGADVTWYYNSITYELSNFVP